MLTINIASVGEVTLLAMQQVDEESAIVLVRRTYASQCGDEFIIWRVARSHEFGLVAFNGKYTSSRLQAEKFFEDRTRDFRVALPAEPALT